jgi:hypothetical protein
VGLPPVRAMTDVRRPIPTNSTTPGGKMSGVTTKLQSRWDYSMLATNFAGGKSMQAIVARRIAVDRYRECIFMARVHNISPFNAGAVVTLFVAPDPYTEDDPSIIWKTPSASQVSVSWTQGTDTVPQAKQLALVAPFGPLVTVIWQFTMATTPVDTVYSVSLDMNLKGE